MGTVPHLGVNQSILAFIKNCHFFWWKYLSALWRMHIISYSLFIYVIYDVKCWIWWQWLFLKRCFLLLMALSFSQRREPAQRPPAVWSNADTGGSMRVQWGHVLTAGQSFQCLFPQMTQRWRQKQPVLKASRSSNFIWRYCSKTAQELDGNDW